VIDLGYVALGIEDPPLPAAQLRLWRLIHICKAGIAELAPLADHGCLLPVKRVAVRYSWAGHTEVVEREDVQIGCINLLERGVRHGGAMSGAASR
jgi:hypothetical protein